MKKIMSLWSLGLVLSGSSVFAAEATGAGEGSLLSSLFIGFFALIIVFQLVPATLMLIGMLRGIFSRDEKKAATHR